MWWWLLSIFPCCGSRVWSSKMKDITCLRHAVKSNTKNRQANGLHTYSASEVNSALALPQTFSMISVLFGSSSESNLSAWFSGDHVNLKHLNQSVQKYSSISIQKYFFFKHTCAITDTSCHIPCSCKVLCWSGDLHVHKALLKQIPFLQFFVCSVIQMKCFRMIYS